VKKSRPRIAQLIGFFLIAGAGQLIRGYAAPPQDEPLKITLSGLPDGTVGQMYYCVVAVSGGKRPYDYSAKGLAPGLALGSRYAEDTILGRPTTAGTYMPEITVSDSAQPPATASASLKLTVAPSH
jgi:hypothetical protein